MLQVAEVPLSINRERDREREFHTSHATDAFNPNSFTVPWVHNSAEGVNKMGGDTEERKRCWQRHDESIIWTVWVCMHVPGVWSTEPPLADGPCYPRRLNAKMVIKVEWSHRQPNPDWHQEAGNLNVFTWWSSIAQRVGLGLTKTHSHICTDRLIHTRRLTVICAQTNTHTHARADLWTLPQRDYQAHKDVWE